VQLEIASTSIVSLPKIIVAEATISATKAAATSEIAATKTTTTARIAVTKSGITTAKTTTSTEVAGVTVVGILLGIVFALPLAQLIARKAACRRS
jgi:hypothetical protein